MLSTRFIPSNSNFPKAILFGYNISLSSTSHISGMLILALHHKENNPVTVYRNGNRQDNFTRQPPADVPNYR